jgi:hypothetical protein
MQPVCRSAPARPLTLPGHLGTTCQARATATSRGGRGAVTVLRRSRRQRDDGACRASGAGRDREQAEVVAESLEEEAIAGEDEGRRPTHYNRRAHIFEESPRVFTELKQHRDGDGGVHGTAAGT